MILPIYQVDAFTQKAFGGNPAAIVPLDAWLPDATLQAIAAENNLAETAFYVPQPDGSFHLRWFTPAVEVDLCGHATVATAFVLAHCRGHAEPVIRFQSLSGELTVAREGAPGEERFVLDFPARPPQSALAVDPGFAAALGGAPPRELWDGKMILAVYDSAAAVQNLRPDFRALKAIPHFGLIATAPGTDCDFVSRFFAPGAGIDEDPVTGSAHCVLTPYWAGRLGKSHLTARQVSARGGELWCEHRGPRTGIAGHAVLFLEGRIHVPE